jgi:hypothetical protein
MLPKTYSPSLSADYYAAATNWLALVATAAALAPCTLNRCRCLLLRLSLLLPTDIQRSMGAVFERNQTSGATVLRAIVCPKDHYGVVGVAVGADFKKYGRVATPCTQCPTNMITAGTETARKVPSINVVNTVDRLLLATTSRPVADDEGYYTVDACFTKPGYGG